MEEVTSGRSHSQALQGPEKSPRPPASPVFLIIVHCSVPSSPWLVLSAAGPPPGPVLGPPPSSLGPARLPSPPAGAQLAFRPLRPGPSSPSVPSSRGPARLPSENGGCCLPSCCQHHLTTPHPAASLHTSQDRPPSTVGDFPGPSTAQGSPCRVFTGRTCRRPRNDDTQHPVRAHMCVLRGVADECGEGKRWGNSLGGMEQLAVSLEPLWLA